MAAFLAGLDAAWTFLSDCFSRVFVLYTTVPVFMAVLALWVLDRVFGIFRLIKN